MYRLKEYFNKHAKVLYGFSDISFSKYRNEYKCALVFAVPYKEVLSVDNYREDKLEMLICEARETIDTIVNDIVEILKSKNIKYYIPQVAQTSEELLEAPISFKFVAVNAGLGWIGKNGVLITEKYGPRVRLAVVLVDYNFKVGTPIMNSKCDESCNLCIDVCPHKALKGVMWDISTQRSELINYKLCNEKRSIFLKDHNRKNSCGLCMVICPYGL